MASYKSNLPTAGTGGGSPTFQRGTFTWVTSTATTVTIPITQVSPARSFITQLRGSTASGALWIDITFIGRLNAAGDGIEIFRSGGGQVSAVISWEVGTNPAVSVQRGTRTFSTIKESNTTIPTISDLTKASAVIVGTLGVNASSTTATPTSSMVRCELTASNLKLIRDASEYPVQVSWEILTYV